MLATAFIALGLSSCARTTTCSKDFFTSISEDPLISKAEAISTPSVTAHSSKSLSIASACAGAQEMRTVKMTLPRITTCSTSRMFTAKGERV